MSGFARKSENECETKGRGRETPAFLFYPDTIVMKIIFAILTTWILSACLFESEKDKVFRVYLSGRVDSVYARDDMGAPVTLLGPGLETKNASSIRFSHGYRDSAIIVEGTAVIPPFPQVGSEAHYLMTLWRDSTFLMRNVSRQYMAQFADPYKEFGTAYHGTPCRFSRPEGFQWGPAGYGDTVPLVFTGIRLTLAADSLRLSLILDSAASEESAPRADLAGRPWIYASALVTCP